MWTWPVMTEVTFWMYTSLIMRPVTYSLRMNLFVHRDLWRWLNQPFKFPPLLPESSQPSFTFS